MKYLLIYLLIINIITFFVYGFDKHQAKNNGWRVREATLLVSLPFLLGTIGAMLGMKVFHHKTKKFYFKIGLVLILICQIALFIFLKYKQIL